MSDSEQAIRLLESSASVVKLASAHVPGWAGCLRGGYYLDRRHVLRIAASLRDAAHVIETAADLHPRIVDRPKGAAP